MEKNRYLEYEKYYERFVPDFILNFLEHIRGCVRTSVNGKPSTQKSQKPGKKTIQNEKKG